jgi:glycerophosphoryl diester phosphodiesterase
MSGLPLIIGHRGASAHAPENTLAALKMAIDRGADGVEFDVRLAKDGVPVVIHDADLWRVASLPAAVADLTSTELATIDVGSWFNRAADQRSSGSYSGERVPTLEQLLDLLTSSSGLIFVELKTILGNEGQLVKRCCEVISTSGLEPRIIIKSFSLSALEHVRNIMPEVSTAALFEPGVATLFRRRSELVDKAVEYGANHISLHWSLVNRRLMDAANDAEMHVTVWTVDHTRWIARARAFGIRSLITNDPQKLLAIRNAV